MTPKGIQLLQGEKRRTFGYTIKVLDPCCELHDPRGHGCGFTGLCRKLYEQRDSDWMWERRFNSTKWWKPLLQKVCRVSDWLVHSIPRMSSQKEGAM